MKVRVIYWVFFIWGYFYVATCKNLKINFAWKQLDYEFENEIARNFSLQSREFIPRNNVPFGVEIWREKVFITVPRRMPGVPSTLNYININSQAQSPLLIPYPDWNSNNISSRILISTYRLNVDSCNRLWVIDSGSIIDFDGNGETLISPRIRAFDLNTDALLVEYVLKSGDYSCQSAFTNIVADVGSSCEATHIYSVDVGSNSLVVFSLSENTSWRIKHPFFLPDPMQTFHKVGNLEFDWADGLFGIALTEKLNKNSRYLYAHPMASLNEFAISTEMLKNQTALAGNMKRLVKLVGTRKPTFQAAANAYDQKNGIYFYSLVSKNAVGCWNPQKGKLDKTSTDIVAQNNITMIYFSDVKVDKNANLWAISNKLPVTLYGNFDLNEVNFRIFSAPVRQVIKGTNCEYGARHFWLWRV